MSEHGWKCLLPFDTDDGQFARGFEAGRLWEMLKHDTEPFGQHIHSENAEMVLRMGETCEREVQADPLSDEWMFLRVDGFEEDRATERDS